MNKHLYSVLYVFQRIINAPSLPISIVLAGIFASFYGAYLVKRKGLSTMEAMLQTQMKSLEIMKSLYFQIKIQDATFNISHLAVMFWMVILWLFL